MIKICILPLFVAILLSVSARTVFSQPHGATLVFRGDNLFLEAGGDSLHLGEVTQGTNTTIMVRVVNQSSQDFNISNVRGSCRLSVPTWPRAAIKPGKEGFIHLRYDSGGLGRIDRNVTINSNANRNVFILRIVGLVVPSPKPRGDT